MSNDAEVVIVGAGVAGASMAIVLARLGVSVLMLEKSAVHVDRIRGNSITPWGIEEAQNLGVLDILTKCRRAFYVAPGAVRRGYIAKICPFAGHKPFSTCS